MPSRRKPYCVVYRWVLTIKTALLQIRVREMGRDGRRLRHLRFGRSRNGGWNATTEKSDMTEWRTCSAIVRLRHDARK